MLPHPTKTDTWIPGERTPGDNLCMEIPIGEMQECVLGKPDLSTLTTNHLTQVLSELYNRGGGPEGKIIQSFFSGATPDELISSDDVVKYADDLIWFYGDAKKAVDVVNEAQRENFERIEKLVQGKNMETECPYEMPINNKTAAEVFEEISLDWKTQLYNHVVKQFGGRPASYLEGITKDTMLPEMAVEEFAKVFVEEHGGDIRVAAELMKAGITEHITLLSATAMNQAFKEKGLMPALTKVTDNMIEAANSKGMKNDELARLMGESGYQAPLSDYLSNTPFKPTEMHGGRDVVVPVEPTPSEDQFVDPKRVKFDSKGNVIKKRKKSKQRSNHIPNMKNRSVKRALGATILGMLGKVQRDTQDAQKRALLDVLPAADVIEMATGQKLPDYQANLINAMQAKATPDAPIVQRMNREEVLTELQEECIAVQDQVTQLEDKSFEQLLDETLKAYLAPEFFPEGVDQQALDAVVAKTRQHFLDRNEELNLQNVFDKFVNEMDEAGLTPPYEGTKVRAKRDESGRKTYHLTIDQHDPDPKATIEFLMREVGKVQPITVTNEYQGLSVMTVGEVVKDLRVGYADESCFYHYERFSESAADELKSTIRYVDNIVKGNDDYWAGLISVLMALDTMTIDEIIEASSVDQLWEVVNKMIVQYTVGYVRGIADATHAKAQATPEVAPADLGN